VSKKRVRHTTEEASSPADLAGVPSSADSPAISFSHQRSFEHLVKTLVQNEDGRPVTLVCGAGVSIDVGLPGWQDLIKRLCESVDTTGLAEIIRLDPIDPMRQAGYVVEHLLHDTDDRTHALRTALYKGVDNIAPGQLAIAIADLAASLGDRCRIITTNFDSQLERALEMTYDGASVASFSLDSLEAWRAHEPAPTPGVLHLHGMVENKREPLTPVVLTEPDFHRHGPAARAVISEALSAGHVIFVGVSMTDPNLVLPLADNPRTEETGEAFLLSIAEPLVSPDASPAPIAEVDDLVHEYSVARCAYLMGNFGLRTVLVKSYSQVRQILADLPLARSDPANYLSDDPALSQRYGFRLSRRLDFLYQNIGASSDQDYLEGAAQRDLSDRLDAALEWDGGPKPYLASCLKSLAQSFRKYRVSVEYLKAENLALFLWMRTRQIDRQSEGGNFSIRLVATSAYAHREEFSFRFVRDIRFSRSYPAVTAAFFGRMLGTNFDSGYPLWRSAVAMPIDWVSQADSGAQDVLSVGVVTLNSNRRMVPLDALLKDARDDKDIDIQAKHLPSLRSFLSWSQREELNDRIHNAALRVLGADDGGPTRA
jgi:hypothetical protein